MAKATIRCKCEQCGRDFDKVKYFRSGKDADHWAEWAKSAEPYTLCIDCYRAKQEAQEAAKAAEYELPVISGKSDKQIDYASKLRARYVSRHDSEIKQIQEITAKYKAMEEAEKKDLAKSSGLTYDEDDNIVLAEGFKRTRRLADAYLCLTESDAGTIIETLRYHY